MSEGSFRENSFFKNNGRDSDGHRRVSSVHQEKNINMNLLSQYFMYWINYLNKKVDYEGVLVVWFESFRIRYLIIAFGKWNKGIYAKSMKDKGREELTTVADVMLQSAQILREELQADLRMVLATTSTMKLKMKLLEQTKENREILIKSEQYNNMEEGMDLKDSCLYFYLDVHY